jgi:3-oxoacyl-[acyl-carrier protein] reductase
MITLGRFKNKVIVITGASRGIGRATAIRFGQEGGFVFVCFNKNKEKADEVVDLIKKSDGDGVSLQMDVSQPESVKIATDEIKKIKGRVDVLVNNAGILLGKLLPEYDEDLMEKVISVNEKGIYWVTKELLPIIPQGGVIVNLASSAGESGSESDPIYAASKAAVIGFTKSLAKQLAPKIRVNAVAPGVVETDLIKNNTENWRRLRTEQILLREFAHPEDIAEAIVFLASSSAKHITGATLDINGGYYLR